MVFILQVCFWLLLLTPKIGISAKTPAAPPPSPASNFSYEEKGYAQWYVAKLKAENYSYYKDVVSFENEGTKKLIKYETQQFINLKETIAEENLVAKTESTPEMLPVFFSYRRVDNDGEQNFNGSIKNMKLKVTTEVSQRKGGKSSKDVFEYTIQPGTVFSSYIQLFLARHLSSIPENATVTFPVINESGFDTKFKPDVATVTRKTKTQLPTGECVSFNVKWLGHESDMCVGKKGELLALVNPTIGLEIIPTSENVAKKFFILPTSPKKKQ